MPTDISVYHPVAIYERGVRGHPEQYQHALCERFQYHMQNLTPSDGSDLHAACRGLLPVWHFTQRNALYDVRTAPHPVAAGDLRRIGERAAAQFPGLKGMGLQLPQKVLTVLCIAWQVQYFLVAGAIIDWCPLHTQQFRRSAQCVPVPFVQTLPADSSLR